MLFKKHKKNDLSKFIALFIIFITLSFLMISTFQWNYNFSSNIWNIRIWQYLLAFFSGAALGVAGFLLQKLSKNNLADISILGLGSLNIIFIALYILARYDGTKSNLATIHSHLPLISISTSIFGTSVIYSLTKNKEKNSEKFIIVGISFQFLFEAISIAITNSKLISDSDTKAQIDNEIKNFTFGRFPNVQELSEYASWRITIIISIFFIFLITLLVYWFRKEISLIEANEELAKFYGIKVKLLKGFLYLCVALLAGIESAMIGSVALLGIVASNLAKFIFGNRTETNIFASFLIGGMLVLLASFISVNLNNNIPIGYLSTALIAPIFLYFIFKRR